MSTYDKRKHPTTGLSETFEPELLVKQRKIKHRSKSNRNDISYQRFVRDLEKEIQGHLNQSLRENRFDTRVSRPSEANSALSALLTILKSRRSTSTVNTHRSNETDTLISYLSSGHEPSLLVKQNEKQRLTADIQTILNGPAMRNFYSSFLRPVKKLQ